MNWSPPYAEVPSTALLILGSIAKAAGHTPKILHLDIDHVDLKRELKRFKPDIVGVTVNTFQVKSAREICKTIREVSKDIKIVVGGPHAPVWDGESDKVVVGEGETEWCALLGGTVGEIDYSLVDLSRFTGIGPQVGATPSACIMASRGCPSNCIFCNTPVFWGKKVRYRSPESVVDEVERLHKMGMREVFFQDDTFNLNHKWAGEIFEGLIKKKLNKDMIFRITGRVNEKLVTKEYLDLAFKAGVWNIFYGIESGSQTMLDRMKKGITVAEIKRAVRMTHEAHITTTCSFIVGLPGESWRTLGETDKLIREIKPTRYGWCFACPFPMTEFEREVKAKGHVLQRDYADYAYGMLIIRTDELDYDQLAAFQGFSY